MRQCAGIVGLFFLAPLGLRLVYREFDAFQLFQMVDGAAVKVTGDPSYWQWLGFFGAELLKSVPLVDWSEVFQVASDSPIRHVNADGALMVFGLRVAMDLLLLASVVQAAQIATRLRDQNEAFEADLLPVLDPFAEGRRLIPIGAAIEREMADHGHMDAAIQPALDFPPYEAARLRQILLGVSEPEAGYSPLSRDARVRRAALAMLAFRHPVDDESLELIVRVIDGDAEMDMRLLAMEALAENDPIRAPALLAARLSDRDDRIAEQAAQMLARLGTESAREPLLQLLADERRAPSARMAAGVALGRVASTGDAALIDALRAAPEADGSAAFAKAYALARLTGAPSSPVPEMVEIEGGVFRMGSAEDDEHARDTEKPQRQVRVAGFELGRYAVTFEEYDAYCDATGAEKPGDEGWGRGRRPVINVSWRDAQRYAAWLRRVTGLRWRLPSEAEWEFACRAGTEGDFSFAGPISTDLANYNGDYTFAGSAKGEYRERTVEVGALPANPWRLHEMHGNVWEWCQDPWHESYAGAPGDGTVWARDGDMSTAVLRGGSWGNDPQLLRSAVRVRYTRGFRGSLRGFRLART